MYILKEAELDASIGGNGLELGSVGSRIVSEVFAGLLLGDPASYAILNPEWDPGKDLPSLLGVNAIHDDWTFSDIITCSGLPVDGNDIAAMANVIDLTDTGALITN